MTGIITIFDIVWDIHPGIIISVKFCAILPQKIWVIEIFLLFWISIISEIVSKKTLKLLRNMILENSLYY